MSYPQGFLFQPPAPLALHPCPSFGSGVMLGPRTEELGRSSSGSAFAPYSGSATSPGFNSHLPYGGEPRAAATLSSLVGPGYDPSSGVSGSLDYPPFGALGPFPYGDPAYRKNATRDATATLKAWLNEHRKNPYPTKGEKIMLAIITKMTLTQVSTWFANARRRLKKENKMTWTPRNRSEDEDEEDGVEPERNDEDEERAKGSGEEAKSEAAGCRPSSAGGPCGPTYREDVHLDFNESGDGRTPRVPGPASTGAPPRNTPPGTPERTPSPPPKERGESCGATRGPDPAPKPKLWSLAEIATSSDRTRAPPLSQGGGEGPQRGPRGPALPRHLYYAPPFLPGYSGYGPLGPLPGSHSHLNGLQRSRDPRPDSAVGTDRTCTD